MSRGGAAPAVRGRGALGAALGLASLSCRGGDWVIASEWTAPPSLDGGSRSAPDAAALESCPTVMALEAQREAAYPPSSVDSRHAGLWRGTLSGSAAPGFPGPDVALSIGASGAGSLRWGAPQPAPADLEPTRGYLCARGADGVRCATPSGFVAGYEYALAGVVSRQDVLSFVVVPADPWDAWCRLQEPLPRRDPARSCGYTFGVGPPGGDSAAPEGCARRADDGALAPIDCELMYALQRCRCAADGCVAEPGDGIEVGLKLLGAELVGWLWYAGDLDAASVRLERE